MIQPPINLAEFCIDDLLAPAEPAFASTMERFEEFRVGGRLDQYFSSGEAEMSSRVMACPSLVGYLMDEVAKGRSVLTTGESTGRVSDTVIRTLEGFVIEAGGQSIKTAEDKGGRARTFMLLGNTVILYDQDGPLMEFDDPKREGEQFGFVDVETHASAAEAVQDTRERVNYHHRWVREATIRGGEPAAFSQAFTITGVSLRKGAWVE